MAELLDRRPPAPALAPTPAAPPPAAAPPPRPQAAPTPVEPDSALAREVREAELVLFQRLKETEERLSGRMRELESGLPHAAQALPARVPPATLTPVDTRLQALQAEVDWVVTTTAAAHDGVRADLLERIDAVEQVLQTLRQDLSSGLEDLASNQQAAVAHTGQLGAVDMRLRALEALPAQVAAARDTARKELDQLSAATRTQLRSIQEAMAKAAAIEARVDPLEGVVSDLGTRATVLARELQSLTEDSSTRAVALSEVTAGAGALQVALGDLDERVARLQELPAEVQAIRRGLRKELERIDREALVRDSEMHTVADTLGAVDGRLSPLESLAGDLAVERRAVAKDLERLKSATDAHDQALNETREQLVAVAGRVGPLEAIGTDVTAMRRVLRQELDRLTTEAQARDEAVRRLVRQETERGAAATKAQDAALLESTRRLNSIEGRVAPLEALTAEVQSMRAAVHHDVERLTAEAQKSEVALRRTVRDELKRLGTDVDTHHTALGVVEEHLGQLHRDVGSIDAVRSEIDALRRSLSLVEAVPQELQSLRQQIDRAAADARKSGEDMRAGVREELQRIGTEVAAHEAALGRNGENFGGLVDRLRSVEAMPGEVQAFQSAVQREVERLAGEVRSKEQAQHEANGRLVGLDRRLSGLETASSQLSEATSAGVAQALAAEKRVDDATARLTARIRRIEEALNQTESRLARLGALPDEVQGATRQLDSLVGRIKLSQDAVGDARNMQQRSLQMADRLGERMSAQEAAIAALTERLQAVAARVGGRPPEPRP